MKKGTTIKLLDHGFVTLRDWMGSDEDIIEAARMSTGGGFKSWDPYEKHPKGDLGLLSFLWENWHHTPFEMCELKIEVQAPIMVFREWHRHRTQSYNEFSARYAQMPNRHYVPSVERIIAATQKSGNKQANGKGILAVPGFPEGFSQEGMADHVRTLIDREQQSTYKLYEDLLSWGIAPEVARIDTPVARYSCMQAKTDLRNWLAFLTLRSEDSAQWEIRQYAYAVGYIVSRRFPRTWDLWLNHDRKKGVIRKDGFLEVKEAA